MRRTWPDLALRARNAKRDDWPGKRQGWSRPEEVKLDDALAAREFLRDDEVEYIAHLKDCVTCRGNVAMFARMGVPFSSKVLIAAGVEVLN